VFKTKPIQKKNRKSIQSKSKIAKTIFDLDEFGPFFTEPDELVWFAVFISVTKRNQTTIISSNSTNPTQSTLTQPRKESLSCTPTFVHSPLQIIKIA